MSLLRYWRIVRYTREGADHSDRDPLVLYLGRLRGCARRQYKNTPAASGWRASRVC